MKKTIIISTHRIKEIATLSTRIILLKNGQLIASGNPNELIKEKYYKTLKIQIEITNPTTKKIQSILKNKNIIQQEIIYKSTYTTTLLLTTTEDIRTWLWNTTIKHNLEIRELTPITPQLEEVFNSLTY